MNTTPSSKPRPWVLAETSWATVKQTPYKVAVLPWGATEAHNYHLPYATDNYEGEAIAIEAARLAWDLGARVTVLPNIPFGVQTGQLDIPLCVNLNPSTQLAMLGDIIDSVARADIEKLVIFNGHGGNEFRQMLRELQPQFPSVFLSTVFWFQVLPTREWFTQPGDHADETETSLMMHLQPHLVEMEKAGKGTTHAWKVSALREKWAWAQRDWLSATDDTGSGDPSLSTALKGELFFQALTAKIAGYFVELATVPLTDLYE